MTESNAVAQSIIDFDPTRFDAWMRARFPGLQGQMRLERVGGGQSNPTYFVTFDDARFVLRKRPSGDLPASAHDVGREFRIISALAGSDVPVPAPLAFEADTTVVGTVFYLMQRVDGPIFHASTLPEIPPARRRDYYAEHARVLAALHATDWQQRGLASLARPGSFLRRQAERWVRAWDDEAASEPMVRAVAAWLLTHVPDDEHAAIVHGDFKFTNVIFAPDGPKIIAVLDWELCTIGDPLTDVAHVWSSIWGTAPDEYGGIMGVDLEASGLPEADGFLERYYTQSRSARRLTPFHFVLAHLRNAGIFHGIRQRANAGNANAANAEAIARLDRVYLQRAHDIVVAQRD